MSFGNFDDPWPDDRRFPRRKHKRNRNEFRTYSKEERSKDLSFYEPFSLETVEMDCADDEDKAEALACLLYESVNDASASFFAYDIETEMRSKGFGPGEGFPEGIIYYAWDLRNAKVEVSAVDYILFILDWAEDMVEDEQIFPLSFEDKFVPELERDVIKPMFERILHIYAILFHHNTENRIRCSERFSMEESFDRFIYGSLYWGLLDFNSETAKYLQEQIDIPRNSYLRERERDNYR